MKKANPHHNVYKTPLGEQPGAGCVLVAMLDDFYWLPLNPEKLDEMAGELYDRWNFGDGSDETKVIMDAVTAFREARRRGVQVTIHGIMGNDPNPTLENAKGVIYYYGEGIGGPGKLQW